MPSTEVIASRHPELDDAPLRHRYSLEGKIGRGGMGVVAEAQDRRIGRRVAIKRLAGAPTPEMVQRFVREARIQGRLDHPAVVPVYDLGIQSDGRPYFAMRKLTGVTLAEVLHARASGGAEAYPRARLLEAFVDTCLAIEYAHTRRVVHRDLKPANIMLGEYGEVYVLDWGVACTFEEAQRGDVVGAGTEGYMAPEQARGEPVDATADVYGLGCILRDVLGADVPADLVDIVAAAQAKDHKVRIQSARELAHAVEHHLDADRDVVAQAAKVEEHVARARQALAVDRDAYGARATAMREVGRALALDARHPGATALVRSLLLEPPSTPPPEVVAALEEDEVAAGRAQGRAAAMAYLGYTVIVPILAWQGFLDWRFPFALLAVVLGLAAVATAGARGRIPTAWPWLSLLGMSLVLVLLSRILGPFVVPPVMAVLVATAMSAHPKVGAWWWVVIGASLGSVGAWAFEEAGVLAQTMHAEGDGLRLTSTVVKLPAEQVTLGLVVSLMVVCVVTTGLVRSVVARHHEARRRLARQAWHLQHLVPGEARDPEGP
jgi:eukaryotic-like serine/threonine-protein kinase